MYSVFKVRKSRFHTEGKSTLFKICICIYMYTYILYISPMEIRFSHIFQNTKNQCFQQSRSSLSLKEIQSLSFQSRNRQRWAIPSLANTYLLTYCWSSVHCACIPGSRRQEVQKKHPSALRVNFKKLLLTLHWLRTL